MLCGVTTDLCLDARKDGGGWMQEPSSGSRSWKCRDCRRPALAAPPSSRSDPLLPPPPAPCPPPGNTDNNQARHSHSNKGNLDYLECVVCRGFPIVSQHFGSRRMRRILLLEVGDQSHWCDLSRLTDTNEDDSWSADGGMWRVVALWWSPLLI